MKERRNYISPAFNYVELPQVDVLTSSAGDAEYYGVGTEFKWGELNV